VTPDLVPITELGADDLLEVVEQAFGRHRGHDWFDWKHREGPWGPSTGLAAVDDSGCVGVSLLLPWRFRFGDETIDALRAVEAATVPRARGRGVFTRLNAVLDPHEHRGASCQLLFATPNALSREGLVKLGWSKLGPIPHAYRLTPVTAWSAGGSADIVGMDGLDQMPAAAAGSRIATAWTAAAMRWRIDPRSGHDYRVAHLEHADAPTGLVYRIASRRRTRILAAIAAWGPLAGRRALTAGAARQERAPLVLDTAGPGALPLVPGRSLRRGSSLLMMTWRDDGWPSARWPLGSERDWALTFADLEGVI
jgi:hypothetical protein